MTRTDLTTTSAPRAAPLRTLTIAALVVLLALFTTTSARGGILVGIPLGTAESFAVLAGQSVTNTGATTITGDIGIHPGAGTPNIIEAEYELIDHTGTLYDTGAEALAAQADLTIAYLDAQSRMATATILVDLAGEDLGPGVYESTDQGAFMLGGGGTLTLTGEADDVWIFKSSSALDFTSGSSVVLAGDADPCNVFWLVESSATLETGATVVGTILALTTITLATGATIEGRALARNGSVTMDANTITNAVCTALVDDDEEETDDGAGTTAIDEGSQVEEVPAGPVAAGGDRGLGTTAPLTLLAILIAAAVAIGTFTLVGRRRTSN
jgi:hypothetical protein